MTVDGDIERLRLRPEGARLGQVILALLAAVVGATAGVPLGRWLENRDRLNAHGQSQKVLEAMGGPTASAGMTGGGFYFFSAEEILKGAASRC